MFDYESKPVKVAILDLYEGQPNQGMRCFQEILDRYKDDNGIDLTYEIFDVRGAGEVPGTGYDVYISSGGPGSPIDSVGTEWEAKYFDLIEKLDRHNKSSRPDKKYVFFVCHSFQIMCRQYKLGHVCLRKSPSFGVLPVHRTDASYNEPVLDGLPDPFYIVDSRKWQVIEPDMDRLQAMGATILAWEKERPHKPELKQCVMAIRFNEYFFGTQFHPEADPQGMLSHLLTAEKKAEVIETYGLRKYEEMLHHLNDSDKIRLTQMVILPNFLDQATHRLQEA